MKRCIAGIALLLVTVAGCSKAPVSGAGPAGGPSPAKGNSSSAAPAGAPGEVRYYTCAKLLSGQEVRQATGLADAKFMQEEKNGPVKGRAPASFVTRLSV